LWGKNLLDQTPLGGIEDISILFGTPFTSIGAPLTYGIEFDGLFNPNVILQHQNW
jgi:hypothetical protein